MTKETLIKRFEDRRDTLINVAKKSYESQAAFLQLNEYQSIKLLEKYTDTYHQNFEELKKIINNLDNVKIKRLIDEIDNSKDFIISQDFVIEQTLYALDDLQFLEKTKTPWKIIKGQLKSFIKNINSNTYQIESVRLPKQKIKIENKLTHSLKDFFTDNKLLKDYVKGILEIDRFNAKIALEDNSKTLTAKEETKELFKDLPIINLSDPRN